MAGASRGELPRKLVHVGAGGIAFAARFLGPAGMALCALGGLLFNLLVLPRLAGRALSRRDGAEGVDVGIVAYPLVVLWLVLLFWQRPEVAAAAWGILAFGDGMAAVVGTAVGRTRLPWNPRKSWAGTLAHFVFGAAAASALLLWTAPGRYPLAYALAAGAVASAGAALLESLPLELDDNLGVPLVTGLLLHCLLLAEGGWGGLLGPGFGARLATGVAVNLALAAAGYATRGIDRSGLIAGFLLGTAIWAALDWRGYLLLFAFVVLGSLATRIGYARKAAARLAQERGGRRGARNALAKLTVALLAAVFARTTPWPELFTLAYAGALATATADTVSSELGQLWGRRTVLITTLRPAPRGSEGAVSLAGTLAGVAAALVVGGLGWAAGLFGGSGIAVVALAALLGTTLESLAGATLEQRRLLDNEAVNFLATLCGALAAAALSRWMA